MKHGESDVKYKLVYKLHIWVFLGSIFGKENEALISICDLKSNKVKVQFSLT